MRKRWAIAVGAVAVGAIAFLLWDPAGEDGAPRDPLLASSRGENDGAEAGDGEITPEDPLLQGRRIAQTATREDASPPGAPETAPSPPLPAYARPGTGRVVGRVLHAGSTLPIAGEVVIYRREGKDLLPLPEGHPFSARIDDEGYFVHEGLPSGSYRISVRAPGYVTNTHEVEAGADAVFLEIEEALTISGVLVEMPTGEPVAGVEVRARPVTSPAGIGAYAGVSGADGAFRIPLLPAGEYVLTLGQLHQAGGTEWAALTVGPIAAGATDVRVKATRGLAIAGEIRDAFGALLQRPVRVEALGRTARGDGDYSRRSRVSSTPEGRFRIPGLAAGRYDLSFEPLAVSGDASAEYAPLSATRWLDVPAGSEDLVVEMRPGVAMVGRVVDLDGNAVGVPGALYVHPVGTSAGSQGSVIVMVASDGTFHSPPLDDSVSYRILATSFEGFRQGTVESVRPGPAEIVITLEQGGRITGKVVDEAGKPVPWGIPVFAYAAGDAAGERGGTSVAYTQGAGSFRLDGLGAHAFTLRAGGGQSAYVGEETVDGVRPGATDVVLVVKIGVALSGTLLDRDGNPVKTHYLAASEDGRGPRLAPSTTIDADDGSFTIRGLRPGTVRLRARVGGAYVELGEFEAPAKDIVVTLPE